MGNVPSYYRNLAIIVISFLTLALLSKMSGSDNSTPQPIPAEVRQLTDSAKRLLGEAHTNRGTNPKISFEKSTQGLRDINTAIHLLSKDMVDVKTQLEEVNAHTSFFAPL